MAASDASRSGSGWTLDAVAAIRRHCGTTTPSSGISDFVLPGSAAVRSAAPMAFRMSVAAGMSAPAKCDWMGLRCASNVGTGAAGHVVEQHVAGRRGEGPHDVPRRRERIPGRQRLPVEDSEPTPAMRAAARASTRAASSTIGPRAVLVRNPVGFITAMRRASSRPREECCSGQQPGQQPRVPAAEPDCPPSQSGQRAVGRPGWAAASRRRAWSATARVVRSL